MKIGVIGTGYVGLVTAAGLAELGHTVTGTDKLQDKIERISKGDIPIYEPGLEGLLTENVRRERLRFSPDLDRTIREADVIFVCVGTPQHPDGSADMSQIEEVSRLIARNLNDYKVVVEKSTVPVKTSFWIKRTISLYKKAEVEFDVASNPEFLREGSAIEDFMRPNRVVIGTEDEQAAAIMKDLYRPLYLIETPFVMTDVVTSELIKYASNAFLATKITFINEVAELCERLGADVHHVARGMGLDRRIGPKFLHPGPGYGGSCFPKDTKALTEIARQAGRPFEIVETVVAVNDRVKLRMVDKIRAACGGSVAGLTVGVLGLSFKPETDDMREAPSIPILHALVADGAKVQAFDPVAMDNAREALPAGVVYCKDSYDAASGADCLVILTEWNQFRSLDLERLRRALRRPLVVDLRNVYEPERMRGAGFEYDSVGRAAVDLPGA